MASCRDQRSIPHFPFASLLPLQIWKEYRFYAIPKILLPCLPYPLFVSEFNKTVLIKYAVTFKKCFATVEFLKFESCMFTFLHCPGSLDCTARKFSPPQNLCRTYSVLPVLNPTRRRGAESNNRFSACSSASDSLIISSCSRVSSLMSF